MISTQEKAALLTEKVVQHLQLMFQLSRIFRNLLDIKTVA